jgi:hypothetical protein
MREVGSHFIFIANRLFGLAQVHDVHLARGTANTEESVRATIRYGAVQLEIDAAVSGDIDDYNHFEVVGSRKSAVLTDWYRLEYEGVTSDRMPPTSSQLDHLALMLAGKPHQLATFQEAQAVVETIETILARSS